MPERPHGSPAGFGTPAPEPEYGLSDEQVASFVALLEGERPEDARPGLDALHPADLADLVEMVSAEQRQTLLGLYGDSLPAEMLASLSPRVLARTVKALPVEAAGALAGGLATDDAVYVLESVGADARAGILEAMPADRAELARQALDFPLASAARLMQRDFVAIPAYWTIGQVIDHLRESDRVPDEFYALFVVTPGQKPVGTIPLHRAVRARREVPVQDIMTRDPKVVDARMNQEEVAFLFDQYELTSAPVVDSRGRLIGMVTVDDVVDVIQDVAGEDMLRLGGVVGPEDFYTAVFQTARSRFSWLLVNLLTAFLASAAIAVFSATIEQIVALAVLMPIVASMGGNAGTQTLTVVVRAMAMRELASANALRMVGKEILVGASNGAVFAALTGAAAGLWFASAPLGLVIAAAMMFNLVVAGLAGAVVPLALARMGVDPAIGAAVVLTTVTDVVGFFAFLGLAHVALLG